MSMQLIGIDSLADQKLSVHDLISIPSADASGHPAHFLTGQSDEAVASTVC
jgi:hypothetical protein